MPKHTSCSPQLPCHDARHCSYCAALRQSHVADLAAARYRGGSLTYAVIDPRGYAGVTEARNLKPGSGGLWSVEIGAQVKGLHVNLLIEGQQSFTASDLATISRAQETDFWSKSVDPADLRNIAAYLVKLSGRPRKQEYDGRQYGTWGTWNTARSIAQNMRQRPIIQAAAVQAEFTALQLCPPITQRAPDQGFETQLPVQISRSEAREIASRYLPNLWTILSTG
jgi:hypothetical protein